MAALARLEGDEVILDGLVAAIDGSELVRGEARGPRSDAAAVGRRLAEELKARGAMEILAAIRGSAGEEG